jgi:hypothetical protein
MTEEIQEIDRLIRQSGELADSLIRLEAKLRERHLRNAPPIEEQSERLGALLKQLTELAASSSGVAHQIDNQRTRQQDKAYVTVRRMVANGTITSQEAAATLLQAAVIQGTMTPADAAEQLFKLLRPDLPVSRKIEIHQIAKAAFEARDDVLEKIKPFLKGAVQNQQTRAQQMGKTVAVIP